MLSLRFRAPRGPVGWGPEHGKDKISPADTTPLKRCFCSVSNKKHSAKKSQDVSDFLEVIVWLWHFNLLLYDVVSFHFLLTSILIGHQQCMATRWPKESHHRSQSQSVTKSSGDSFLSNEETYLSRHIQYQNCYNATYDAMGWCYPNYSVDKKQWGKLLSSIVK